MKYDKNKIDEMALALMHLTTFKDEFGVRAWKSIDWEALDRLHEKGFISNPKSKSKSVCLTEKGAKLSEKLFKKYFVLSSD